MAEPADDRRGRPLPPQATMGLLNYVTATSLDEDYAHVSALKESRGAPVTPASRRHPLAFVMLALAGLLLATAAVQTARSAPTQESSRASLVSQVKDRRAELANARDELAALRASVENLQDDYLNTTAEGRSLRNQLNRLGISAGSVAATGPGLRIVADDNPNPTRDKDYVFDTDLQRLVNGLWEAGAEAIAINGNRLTNLSAIRTAGDAITAGRSLSPPYVVDAIGNPETLPARFLESAGGTWWLNLRSLYGIQFTMTSEDDITVPSADNLRLRLARTPGSGR